MPVNVEISGPSGQSKVVSFASTPTADDVDEAAHSLWGAPTPATSAPAEIASPLTVNHPAPTAPIPGTRPVPTGTLSPGIGNDPIGASPMQPVAYAGNTKPVHPLSSFTISPQALAEGGAGLPNTPLYNDAHDRGGLTMRRYAPAFKGTIVQFPDGAVGKYDTQGNRISVTGGQQQAADQQRIRSAQQAQPTGLGVGDLMNSAVDEMHQRAAAVGRSVYQQLGPSPGYKPGPLSPVMKATAMAAQGVADTPAALSDVMLGQAHAVQGYGKAIKAGMDAPVVLTPQQAQHYANLANQAMAEGDSANKQASINELSMAPFGSTLLAGMKAKASGQPIAPALLADLKNIPQTILNAAGLVGMAHGALEVAGKATLRGLRLSAPEPAPLQPFDANDFRGSSQQAVAQMEAGGLGAVGQSVTAKLRAKADAGPSSSPGLAPDEQRLASSVMPFPKPLPGPTGAEEAAVIPGHTMRPVAQENPADLTAKLSASLTQQGVPHTTLSMRTPDGSPVDSATMASLNALAEKHNAVVTQTPRGIDLVAHDTRPPDSQEDFDGLTPLVNDPEFHALGLSIDSLIPGGKKGLTPSEAAPVAQAAAAAATPPLENTAPIRQESGENTAPPSPRVNSINLDRATANLTPEAAANTTANAHALTPLPSIPWGAQQMSAAQAGIGIQHFRDLAPGNWPTKPADFKGTDTEWHEAAATTARNLVGWASQKLIQARNAFAAEPTAANKSALDQAQSDDSRMIQHDQVYANSGGRVLGARAQNAVPTHTDVVRQIAQSVPSMDDLRPSPRTVQNPAARKWGATNTGVTVDEADAIRQRMKDRIAAGTQGGVKGLISRGIHDETGAVDADLVPDLVKLGQFHLEAGARSFGEWAARMGQDVPGLTQQDQRGIWDQARKATAASIAQRQSDASQAAWTQPLAKTMGAARATRFINEIADTHDALWNNKPLTGAQQAHVAQAYNDSVPVRFKQQPNAVVARIRGIVKDAKTGRISYDDPVDIVKQHLVHGMTAPDNADVATKAAAQSRIDQLNGELSALQRDKSGNLTTRGMTDLVNLVHQHAGQNFLDNVKHYVQSGLLSGPATLAKIAISHLLSSTVEQHLVNPVAQLMPGGKNVSPTTLAGTAKAFVAGARGLKDTAVALHGGETRLRLTGRAPYVDPHEPFRPEFTTGTDGSKPGIVGGIDQTAIRAPMHTHTALYHPGNLALYERGMQEGAHLGAIRELGPKASRADIRARAQELYNNPNAYVLEQAHAYRAQQMFNNPNAAAEAVSNFGKKGGPVAKVGVTGQMPFGTVPTNIAGRVLEYHPVGSVVSAVNQYGKALSDGTWNDLNPHVKANVARTLARGVVGGAGMVALGYQLAKNGTLTPPDENNYENGHMTFGGRVGPFNFPKRDVDISGMAPITTPMLWGGTVQRRVAGGESLLSALVSASTDPAAIKRYVTDAPIVRAAANSFDQHPGKNAMARNIAGGISMLTPLNAGARQIAAATDPLGVVRSKQTIGDYLKNGYAGTRPSLPVAHDRFGKTIPEEGGVGLRSRPVGSGPTPLESAINRAIGPSDNTPYTAAEQARYTEKQSLVDQLRRAGAKSIAPGSPIDLRVKADVASGKLTPNDGRYLVRDANEPPIIGKFAGLHVQDAVNIFKEDASPAEKSLLAPALARLLRSKGRSMTVPDRAAATSLLAPYLTHR